VPLWFKELLESIVVDDQVVGILRSGRLLAAY